MQSVCEMVCNDISESDSLFTRDTKVVKPKCQVIIFPEKDKHKSECRYQAYKYPKYHFRILGYENVNLLSV